MELTIVGSGASDNREWESKDEAVSKGSYTLAGTVRRTPPALRCQIFRIIRIKAEEVWQGVNAVAKAQTRSALNLATKRLDEPKRNQRGKYVEGADVAARNPLAPPPHAPRSPAGARNRDRPTLRSVHFQGI